MTRPSLVLTTKRLRLRPFEMRDAADIQRLAGAYEVAYNTLLIPHPYPDGAAEEWIAGQDKPRSGHSEIVFAIALRDGDALIGAIGIRPIPDHGKADLGYWIGVPFWGRGYATEAVGEVIRYGFEELSLNRIEANHFTRNPASGRVMEKNGMRCEGTMRQALRKGDEFIDIKQYGIVREDWIRDRVAGC